MTAITTHYKFGGLKTTHFFFLEVQSQKWVLIKVLQGYIFPPGSRGQPVF